MAKKTRVKKQKVKKAAKRAPAPKSIKVFFKSLGRIFTGEGKSFDEAVESVKVSGGVKVTSVLTMEKDGKKTERIINGRHMQALFGGGSPTTRQIHVKQIKAMFGL